MTLPKSIKDLVLAGREECLVGEWEQKGSPRFSTPGDLQNESMAGPNMVEMVGEEGQKGRPRCSTPGALQIKSRTGSRLIEWTYGKSGFRVQQWSGI